MEISPPQKEFTREIWAYFSNSLDQKGQEEILNSTFLSACFLLFRVKFLENTVVGTARSALVKKFPKVRPMVLS